MARDPMALHKKFLDFHKKNPHIYEQLVKFARNSKARGFSQYSITALFEVVRWHTKAKTEGDVYKVRNSFKPFYARLIMEREADLKDFFITRTASADIKLYGQRVMG